MAKPELSKQAIKRNAIVKYLLSHGEYRTTKQIAIATGIERKGVARSISDIRQCQDYRTKSLKKPFRIRLQSEAEIDELWRKVLYRKKVP